MREVLRTEPKQRPRAEQPRCLPRRPGQERGGGAGLPRRAEGQPPLRPGRLEPRLAARGGGEVHRGDRGAAPAHPPRAGGHRCPPAPGRHPLVAGELSGGGGAVRGGARRIPLPHRRPAGPGPGAVEIRAQGAGAGVLPEARGGRRFPTRSSAWTSPCSGRSRDSTRRRKEEVERYLSAAPGTRRPGSCSPTCSRSRACTAPVRADPARDRRGQPRRHGRAHEARAAVPGDWASRRRPSRRWKASSTSSRKAAEPADIDALTRPWRSTRRRSPSTRRISGRSGRGRSASCAR